MATYVIAQPLGALRVDVRPRPLRASAWRGTPEIYFEKTIDNSRLVKVADRDRNREMAVFAGVMGTFFLLVMIYAWQHFSAVEYGYHIEAQKAQRDSLLEENRGLRLEEASLRNPERIDALARRMGLQSTEPGQVMQLELSEPQSAPVLARAQFEVVSATQ